jgi:GH15 family glucan-1,4-alpha-glucosidase
MAWVAFDRAVKAIERFGLDGPIDRWRAAREQVHAEVCERGFDSGIGAFVQSYGSKMLDASLLMMPLVGFLPPTDPRIRGTVEAIERTLVRDGFVMRYETDRTVDGLPEGEGAFLACTLWLVDCLVLLGRRDDAKTLFERVLSIRSDLGLLAEEYDPKAGRQLGNFPQAFSHVSLVNAANNLLGSEGPAHLRRKS